MHNFNIIYHRVTSILFHDHKWVTDGNFLKTFSDIPVENVHEGTDT